MCDDNDNNNENIVEMDLLFGDDSLQNRKNPPSVAKGVNITMYLSTLSLRSYLQLASFDFQNRQKFVIMKLYESKYIMLGIYTPVQQNSFHIKVKVKVLPAPNMAHRAAPISVSITLYRPHVC